MWPKVIPTFRNHCSQEEQSERRVGKGGEGPGATISLPALRVRLLYELVAPLTAAVGRASRQGVPRRRPGSYSPRSSRSS